MTLQATLPDKESVLSKAFLRAGEQLGLSQAELAKIIGKSRSWVNRLAHQDVLLSPSQKEGELALLFIRLARALYALNDGDPQWTHHFMRTNNSMTRGIPAEQVQSVTGLVSVVQFVDAIRGKI